MLAHCLHMLFAHMRCGADRYAISSRLFWPLLLVYRPLNAFGRCDTLCQLCAGQRVRTALAPLDPGTGSRKTILPGGRFWMGCPHAPRQVGCRYEPVAARGHSTITPTAHTPLPGDGVSSGRGPCINMGPLTKSPHPVDLKRGAGRQPQTPDRRRPFSTSEMPSSPQCAERCVPPASSDPRISRGISGTTPGWMSSERTNICGEGVAGRGTTVPAA